MLSVCVCACVCVCLCTCVCLCMCVCMVCVCGECTQSDCRFSGSSAGKTGFAYILSIFVFPCALSYIFLLFFYSLCVLTLSLAIPSGSLFLYFSLSLSFSLWCFLLRNVSKKCVCVFFQRHGTAGTRYTALFPLFPPLSLSLSLSLSLFLSFQRKK